MHLDGQSILADAHNASEYMKNCQFRTAPALRRHVEALLDDQNVSQNITECITSGVLDHAPSSK